MYHNKKDKIKYLKITFLRNVFSLTYTTAFNYQVFKMLLNNIKYNILGND